MSDSLFRLVEGRYEPTELARGPWDPRAQHGGAPAALIADRLSATDVAGRLTRLNVEFTRPVPMTPLTLEVEVSRAGRQVQRTGATLYADDTLVARAEGLHLLAADGHDESTTSDPLPAPAQGTPPALPPSGASRKGRSFGADAVEIRFVQGAFLELGPATAWFRLRVPVIDDQPVSPWARLAAAADFSNGIASHVAWSTHTFANADLTIAAARDPIGEWVALASTTHAGGNGVAIAEGRLHDEAGRLGISHQSVLVRRREPR